MRFKPFILPATAACLGLLLLAPTGSQGFSVIGGSLDLNQRDVRVRNTFADSRANDNQTVDDQFPGFVGAYQALWKAIVEWGSGRHGDGSGDVTQPQIGSGGANFDASWQARAPGVGFTNDNIISPISSCSGGTLAFAETPISNGWRIRFCENILWDDGPGFISGAFDIQEVGTHEYGHALGLGHSASGSATMRPATSSGSEGGRSIHADDIAGIKSIYGAKSVTKPSINSISGVFQLTITGVNFDASSNEVWFTQPGVTGNGTPIKMFNVPSTGGGTTITLTPPTQAGPGDILVRVPGTEHRRLSNAYPFDPTPDPPEVHCAGKVNTDLCVPTMTFGGFPSESSTGVFNVRANLVVANQSGLLVYGTTGRTSLPFHNGELCVKAPLVRLLPPKNSGDDGSNFCPGSFKVNFNKRIQSGVDPVLTAGQAVNAQWIYRDPGIDSFGDGLSEAMEFVVLP